MKAKSLFLLLLGCLNINLAPAAPALIGSDFSGVIYDVDPNTGVCSNPRNTGLSQVAGFTVTANGQQAFALTSFGSSPANALLGVNLTTGATTFIGNTGLGLVGEGDLCIRPSDGTLFALWNATGGDLHMFTLNPTTGAATDIGVAGSATDLSGLAFAPNGSLYSFENGGRIRQLDPNTAATLNMINVTGLADSSGTAGFAFSDTETLYLACGRDPNSSLYTVNLNTGVADRIGATTYGDGYGLASLTFVPEPAAGSMLGLALTAWCARKKWKS